MWLTIGITVVILGFVYVAGISFDAYRDRKRRQKVIDAISAVMDGFQK